MPNFRPLVKSLEKHVKEQSRLQLYDFLLQNPELDPYTVYAVFRSWFYVENMPRDILEEKVTDDLRAKRLMLEKNYEYQI